MTKNFRHGMEGRNTMKKICTLACVCLLALAVLTSCISNTSSSSQEEIDLEQLYVEQNEFLTATGWDCYISLREDRQNQVYERLFYYCWKTEAVLTLEDIKEYLSSEFEEDGSVRTYNNGNWPEIEAYVNWGWEHEEEMEEFHMEVLHKQSYWAATYPVLWMAYEKYSLHNLNEVMLTIKDENYQPNFIFEEE